MKKECCFCEEELNSYYYIRELSGITLYACHDCVEGWKEVKE